MMPDNEVLLKEMFPIWMANFRANLPAIWESRCISELKDTIASPAIIIGAGPSLLEHNHPSVLVRAKNRNELNAKIICCDRALEPCVKLGLVPSIVTAIDADPQVGMFFRNIILLRVIQKIKAVFSTTVHPDVVEGWPGRRSNIYFVNTHMTGKVSDPYGTDAVMQHVSNKIIMNTSGNVGIFSLILSAYMGAKDIALVGMDMSGHHQIYEEAVRTWISGLSRDIGLRIVNCTEGGNLTSVENMKEMPLSEWLEMFKQK